MVAAYVGEDGFVDVPSIIADGMMFEAFPGLLPEVYDIRERDFPLFDRTGRIYVDNTATTQEPESVKTEMYGFRKSKIRGSNHSKNSSEAEFAQEMFEDARRKVGEFFNANGYVTAFTSGATAVSNYIGSCFRYRKGDLLLITDMEHNSQVLTARKVAKRAGVQVKYIPIIKPDGNLNLEYLERVTRRHRGRVFLNLVHVSNVTGIINPVDEISDILSDNVDDDHFIYLDMAQSAGHIPIDLEDLNVDFAGISSHKMYGPTGMGAMFISKKRCKCLRKDISGGSAVDLVSRSFAAHSKSPARFEPGTQDLEGAYEWGFTIDYLREIGMDRIEQHDRELGKYFLEELQKISGVNVYGPKTMENKTPVVSFNVGGTLRKNYDKVACELDNCGISVRDGCFCSHIYISQLLGLPRSIQETRTAMMKVGISDKMVKLPGAVRASFSFYNTMEDAHAVIKAVREVATKI